MKRTMSRRGSKKPAAPAPPPKPVLRPKGLTKGLEPCPACGKIVRPLHRMTPHPETPECLVIRTQNAYRDRGWVPLTEALAAILTAAECPVELAPGGTHLEPRLVPVLVPKGTRPMNRVEHDEVVHDTPFAPAGSVRLVRALARMPTDFRVRAMRALIQDPDIADSIDAIARLGGRVTGFVHRMVVAAEEKIERDRAAHPPEPLDTRGA